MASIVVGTTAASPGSRTASALMPPTTATHGTPAASQAAANAAREELLAALEPDQELLGSVGPGPAYPLDSVAALGLVA